MYITYKVIVWKNVDERIEEYPCSTYEKGLIIQKSAQNLIKRGHYGECDKVGLHRIEHKTWFDKIINR